MFNNISLSLIKKQCSIDETYVFEDDLLIQYYEGACGVLSEHIGYDLEDFVDEDNNLPSPLVQAILFLCAQWYSAKEPTAPITMSEVPYTLRYLIDRYKKYTC